MIGLRTPAEQHAYLQGFKAGAQLALDCAERGLGPARARDYIQSIVNTVGTVVKDGEEPREDAA